ncbi:hypothetical protein THIX_20554 [Thiomonas sp. X19]|nr:hypothetical protein THIX_20554 [Thiomonas sp. X19]
MQLTTIERCSGHAGTYGVKIGKPVFKSIAAPQPDFIVIVIVIVIGCQHPHYDVRQVIAPATRDALLKDFSAADGTPATVPISVT